MRARDQLIGAVLLVAVTGFGLYRIAQAKNETTVGGDAFRLDESWPAEMAAFQGVRARIVEMGDPALAERLEALRRDGEIWVAPKLGAGRWAAFVDTLGVPAASVQVWIQETPADSWGQGGVLTADE